MAKRRHRSKSPAKKAKVTEIRGQMAVDCLNCMGLDMHCGVAVWLEGRQELSNEAIQFLHLRAHECGYVSRCLRYSLRTKCTGVILLFPDRESAYEFCDSTVHNRLPSGHFSFCAEILANHLLIVAEIEQQFWERNQRSDSDSRIIIRNLSPSRRVINCVLKLCFHFGDARRYMEITDRTENMEFRHLIVSYDFAVQAFAAQLLLDGKLIREQNPRLAVEVYRDEKTNFIRKELARRNKMLFQT